jgi:LmbE family N-acetylglucosaminyl deacetylase
MTNNRLWLLAHQDDEVLGLHLNSKLACNYVIYLTDGVPAKANFTTAHRIDEAKRAWRVIDNKAHLNFFGTTHFIKDGMLVDQVNSAHLNELISICQKWHVSEIVSLQFEGGHQDHDVASLLAEEISRRLNLTLLLYPAYRSIHRKYPFFAVMSSFVRSDKRARQPMLERLKMAYRSLKLMIIYRTQMKTWIGLGLFVIINYLSGLHSYLVLNNTENAGQVAPKTLLYSIRNKRESIDYIKLRKEVSMW